MTIPRTLMLFGFCAVVVCAGRGQEPQQRSDTKREVRITIPNDVTLQSIQKPPRETDRAKSPTSSEEQCKKVFSQIELGISSGNVALFSQHLGSQVAVDLRGAESGSYSPNQAYYVLDNYFKSRRFVDFTFTSVGESHTVPFATGSGHVKGSQDVAQVYVSLSNVGERWVISNIKIY